MIYYKLLQFNNNKYVHAISTTVMDTLASVPGCACSVATPYKFSAIDLASY
jgi:hypothetical protein